MYVCTCIRQYLCTYQVCTMSWLQHKVSTNPSTTVLPDALCADGSTVVPQGEEGRLSIGSSGSLASRSSSQRTHSRSDLIFLTSARAVLVAASSPEPWPCRSSSRFSSCPFGQSTDCVVGRQAIAKAARRPGPLLCTNSTGPREGQGRAHPSTLLSPRHAERAARPAAAVVEWGCSAE